MGSPKILSLVSVTTRPVYCQSYPYEDNNLRDLLPDRRATVTKPRRAASYCQTKTPRRVLYELRMCLRRTQMAFGMVTEAIRAARETLRERAAAIPYVRESAQ